MHGTALTGGSVYLTKCEALRDTSELLFPEENDGYSTIEIFNQEGESIMTNALNEDNYERND